MGVQNLLTRDSLQRPRLALPYFAPGTRETPGPRPFKTVTFTFDDKEMAEQFNSALRQAIKLCIRRLSERVGHLARRNCEQGDESEHHGQQS